MRAILILGMVLLLACGVTGFARDDASKAPAPNPQQLKAQMHRTMADLVEAQSAAEPDQAKIDQLAGQLQSIRRQLWAKAPAPGRGYGQGWAGQGRGQGRGGPAYGGRGYGCPWGGPGWGRGMGMGQGGGMGMGPGRGMGPGLGFVDADGDGVCDNFQPPAAPKK